jgi:hypothetical protein
MAIILLAIYLIARGLTGIFPQLSTPTINIIISIVAIVAGVLFLLGK